MSGYEDRLVRVVHYIHDNLDGDLSLDRLAEVAAMSRFHWHRIWTAMTGETLAQTIRRVRLHRACVLLVGGPAPLAEVARACGYADAASFSRAFRDQMGQTPGAFRAAGRAIPPLWLNRTETTMSHDVRLTEEPPRRVGAIPYTGDYALISRAFETLNATLAARGGWPSVRGMLGIYYDDPRNVPEAERRAHAGAVLAPPFPIEAPLEQVDLAGGRYAVLTFRGPYTGFQAAYDWFLGPWLAASGETLREAPLFEVYLNTPADTAPEDLVTEIYLPLA